MAENFDFPELLEGTGPTLDAAAILQAKGQSDWAQRFGEHGAGKNNLMTRKRHNADIADYTAKLQAAQEAHQAQELKTNKDARDLYFRGKKLEMDKKLGEATLDLRELKFNHDEQLFPEKLATEKARTERLISQDREAVKKARLHEELTAQASMDSEAFMDNLSASGAKPGSQEFIDELVKNRMSFPGSAKAFNDMFRAHSGSTKDPEEFYESRKTALGAAGPNTTVTTKLPGGVTVTDRPVSDETNDLQTRFDKYVLQRARTTDKNAQKFLDGEIAEMKGKLGGFEKGLVAPPAAATAAPAERTVVNPTTGERLVLRNGAWVKP